MAYNSHASEKDGVSYGQVPCGSNHINPGIFARDEEKLDGGRGAEQFYWVVTRKISGLISPFIAVALALAASPLLALKSSGAGGVPPPPMEVTIKVQRGVRAEIPLQIYGRRNELLQFLIRTPPEHGQVTEPRQTGKESAAVIYDPPADLRITHDKFYFSVQSSDGVSSPVEVSITITDAPPVLAVPGSVDFPKILAGTTSARFIELTNHGGGLAVGEMIVDPPWRILGPATYRIGAGEVAVFKLVFEPKEGGVFEGAISFTSNREHSTVLRGESFTPLSISPAKVTMENNIGDPVRTGSFEISNQTNGERTIRIRGGARLLAPDKISVPAHGKVTVPVQTPASDVDPIDAEIRIESEGFSLAAPVKSPAVGPIFRISADRVLLGKQPAAKPGTGSVTIENIGGLPGAVTFTVAAPFVANPSGAVVNAGEKKSVEVSVTPSAPGKYRTWMEIKGGQQEFEVDAEAELYARAARTPVAPGSTPAAAEPEETSRAEPVAPEERRARDLSAVIPTEWGIAAAPAPKLKLLRTTPESATFEWPETMSSAARFRFEMRHFGLDASHNLMVFWMEHHPVTLQKKNGFYTATLGDLRPGEVFAVQVVPLSDTGVPGPRLFNLEFNTPPAPPSAAHISLLQGLLLILVACLGFWAWHTFRRTPTNYL